MGCFKLRNGAELSLLTSIEQHTIVVLSNKHDAYLTQRLYIWDGLWAFYLEIVQKKSKRWFLPADDNAFVTKALNNLKSMVFGG